ncbi:MAG: VWD domain-containing protein [Bradymonadaceae bacterium]|nr:VWD domain-containing protein [Lujinxingiaceae bacterium]
MLGLLLPSLVLALGCSQDEASLPEGQAELCAPGDLENVVAASSWAESRAGIENYRYVADVVGGVARIELLDGETNVLGTMVVRQLFGHAGERDGVMEAVLEQADASPLRLITWGEDIDDQGYTVRMRLERAQAPSLHLTARFESVRCWLQEAPNAAPPCAARLPLQSNAFTLPSCGLIVDERILQQRPPELRRLSYAVASEQGAGMPSAGSVQRDGAGVMHRLDVLGAEGVLEESVVTQWLAQAGLDKLVGTQAERLLTTAFLDRSWWRTLEQHVAHCDVERLQPSPAPSDGETKSLTSSLCPGNQNNERWGEPAQNTRAKVWGDPHLVTFDGYAYGLQATGEYVIFEAIAGEPLLVQGRFEPLRNPGVPECGNLSWTTAAATEVSGKRVSARLYPKWEVRIDGKLVEAAADIPVLEEGASVTVGPSEVNIRWPGGEQVDFKVRGTSLSVEAALPGHRRGQVRGLMGQFDGDPRNDLVLPDGRVLEQPASFEVLYDVFASAWRVSASQSLFDYAAGEDSASFFTPGFPEAAVVLDALPPALVAAAEQSCLEAKVFDAHLLATCVLDLVCLADSSAAQAAAEAPRPRASQPVGRDDLSVAGAVRHVRPPAKLSAEAAAEPLDCRPISAPSIAIFDEKAAVVLDADLELALSAPGSYSRATRPIATTLAAGAQVNSYQLVRLPQGYPQRRYSGWVSFSQPIVGVIVDGARQAASDTGLGALATAYQGEDFEGLRSDEDIITIGEDGRTLELVWSGAGAQRIRVLTQAP